MILTNISLSIHQLLNKKDKKIAPVKKNPAVAKSSGFCDSLFQPLNEFNRALNELYFKWKATLWALTPKPWISIGSPISLKCKLINSKIPTCTF